MLAMSVGTTALAITAATRAEYCAWVTMPCDRPNRDEMVPKVRPVDINRVVYMPSFGGDRNAWVTGYTPAILVTTLTASIRRNAAGAAIRAGTETKEPARMKENGVSKPTVSGRRRGAKEGSSPAVAESGR